MPTLKAHDIRFVLNNGTTYDFMLARTNDGKKAWNVERLFTRPPSMIKQRIDLTITAREDEITSSAARQLKRVKEILEEIDAMMVGTDTIKLTGLDNVQYPIVIDAKGSQLETVIHEQERDPEYQVTLLIWGIYE